MIDGRQREREGGLSGACLIYSSTVLPTTVDLLRLSAGNTQCTYTVQSMRYLYSTSSSTDDFVLTIELS